MRKLLIPLLAVAGLATACNQVQQITVGDGAGISPEILKRIDVSDRQAILFGHYEHLVTVHGRTFEGCCVFDANRIALANYVVRLFEDNTGKKFGDREMLIGAQGDKIFVYIVPRSLNINPVAKTYVVELDRNTAQINSFKVSAK